MTAVKDSYQPGYERAAERILELIVSSGLVPGDRLPTEVELAESLGFSRTIIREAIKILSALGRVQVRKRRGMFVSDSPGLLGGTAATTFVPTDLDQVALLFEYRSTLESQTARLAAARATPAEVRAIERAATESEVAARAGDTDRFNRADDEFHEAVGAAAHNPFLLSAATSARSLQHQSVVLGLHRGVGGSLVDAAHAHVAIALSIRDGESDAAASKAAAHIQTTLDGYRQEIARRLYSPV